MLGIAFAPLEEQNAYGDCGEKPGRRPFLMVLSKYTCLISIMNSTRATLTAVSPVLFLITAFICSALGEKIEIFPVGPQPQGSGEQVWNGAVRKRAT